ncbi:MAG: phage tail protein [Shewanella sp.]
MRGQAGTSVRAFAVGDYAELRLTTDALTEYIAQNISTKMDKTGGGDFNGLYRFLGSPSSRVDLVRTADAVSTSIGVDLNATEGHRFIIGGPNGSNATTPSLLLRPNGYGNGTGQLRIDGTGLVDVVALKMRGVQGTDAGSAVRYDYLANFVPNVREVNGHDLTADFSITAEDVFKAGAIVRANAAFYGTDFQYRQADTLFGLRLHSSGGVAYLQGGKTDRSADQKLYLTGWLGEQLASFKVFSDSALVRRKSGVDYKVFDEDNKPAVADVTGLSDALSKAGGSPVLSSVWVQLRSAMWNGYVAADGQTLSRALYPDALAAIQAGLVPVCTDAEWLADPAKRGCFTLGDGSTTFRVPDYNGKHADSLGAVFMRGDGKNAHASGAGFIQGDAIRNITGNVSAAGAMALKLAEGVLYSSGGPSKPPGQNATSSEKNPVTINFDASRVVPTANENRPVNVTGCWAIKLFGAVQNAGEIDAAALATAVVDLAARMSVVEGRVATLEQRKSTCLVNATGTGAPHETVVTQLPANITINSRYVLPNPFGNNTPVTCWAEVFANGKWSRTGFAFTNGGGYGTDASYVQGEGVVVQTGSNAVLGRSNDTGSGHDIATSVASAPCRVFVRKLEA